MLLMVQRVHWTYQAAKYEAKRADRRCSGNRNVAKFHAVPELRSDFALLYLENGTMYEKSHCVRGNIVGSYDYKMECSNWL